MRVALVLWKLAKSAIMRFGIFKNVDLPELGNAVNLIVQIRGRIRKLDERSVRGAKENFVFIVFCDDERSCVFSKENFSGCCFRD